MFKLHLDILGSPNCDVPVLGTIVLFTIVVVVMISIVYGVRHTRSLRGKLKNSLAELESYSEDVKLLAAAWELQWNQIKLGPEVARGGGGVVRGVVWCLSVWCLTVRMNTHSYREHSLISRTLNLHQTGTYRRTQ